MHTATHQLLGDDMDEGTAVGIGGLVTGTLIALVPFIPAFQTWWKGRTDSEMKKAEVAAVVEGKHVDVGGLIAQQVTAIMTQTNARVALLESREEVWLARIEAVETESETCREQYAAVQSKCDNLEELCSELQRINETLTLQINELQTEKTNLVTQNSALTEQGKALVTEMDALRRDIGLARSFPPRGRFDPRGK